MQDGPKKSGRFIRKDDGLLKHLKLSVFDFEEICQFPLVLHDNGDNTLIYSRLHAGEELQRVIKDHDKMQREFTEAEAARPILQPLDFTTDWQRHLERTQKGGALKIDEEDVLELELEFQAQQEREKLENENAHDATDAPVEAAPPATAIDDEPPVNSEATPTSEESAEDPPPPPQPEPAPVSVENLESKDKNPTHFRTQRENLDTVGKVINELTDEPSEANSFSVAKGEQNEEIDEDSDSVSAEGEAQSEDFIPVTAAAGDAENADGASSPENAAIQEYKDRPAPRPEVNADVSQGVFETAKGRRVQIRLRPRRRKSRAAAKRVKYRNH